MEQEAHETHETHETHNDRSVSSQVHRLREEFASGRLLHPFLPTCHFRRNNDTNDQDSQNDEINTTSTTIANFTDLAAALSLCCGIRTDQTNDKSEILAEYIAGKDLCRRHVILVLCDGLGTSILNKHLRNESPNKSQAAQTATESGDSGSSSPSFLLRHNNNHQRNKIKLRAVFPSTTPAALTTLAVANWPGQHGVPGWDLRDPVGCDFPGQSAGGPIQIRILAERIMDTRSKQPLQDLPSVDYNESSMMMDKIFVEEPWVRKMKLLHNNDDNNANNHSNASANEDKRHTTNQQRIRKLLYINAYNGDDFPTWYQDDRDHNDKDDTTTRNSSNKDNSNNNIQNSATDFSTWQAGKKGFETCTIEETAFHTLGTPKGSQDAIRFFRRGIDAALQGIAQAEVEGYSTYMYLYTAHPDKHMHALGVDHEEVTNIVQGFDVELERFWHKLEDVDLLIQEFYCSSSSSSSTSGNSNCSEESKRRSRRKGRVDASLIVTADHGHVTVQPKEMIQLPESILECLEYANIGVHGKGRHAFLHCRSGFHSILMDRWLTYPQLTEHFVLLTVEQAVKEQLFGPQPPKLQVRPRLGDYIAISLGNATLVTPKEGEAFQKCHQGAHGSLMQEEMDIPFILCTPPC